MSADFTYAVTVETLDDGTFRGIMFVIDHDTGAASVEYFSQSETISGAIDVFIEDPQFRGYAVAAKAEEHVDGAVQVGNHWVVWPDALTLAETVEAIKLAPPASVKPRDRITAVKQLIAKCEGDIDSLETMFDVVAAMLSDEGKAECDMLISDAIQRAV